MTATKTNALYWCVLCLFLFAACQPETPQLSALPTPLSDRAKYEQELKKINLSDKNNLTEWDSIGNLAFTQNVEIAPPYRQTGYFLKGRAEVLAYKIPLKKGEQIDVNLQTDSTDTQVFMDFFRKKDGKWKPIIKSTKNQTAFHFEVLETETYLLRIQPEFHKKASYELKILKNPLYAFPVVGKGNEDIWSKWGDPRGGGKRKHKGIDIFAKRGTPLIAITEGYVQDVSDKGLGGKQVWIRDLKNNNSLYYAHLHEQSVKQGQIVEVGDTIGLVGNTGNAKTTRPHLHFGIYHPQRGAIDPLPYVYLHRNKFLRNTAHIKEDLINKGITYADARLRSKPTSKNSFLKDIKNDTPLDILGASGSWYHVRTLDGEVGYIHRTSVKQLKATILS